MVAVANGSEDIETVTICDVLKRAEADILLVKVPGVTSESQVENPLLCRMQRGTWIVRSILVLIWK